MSSLRDRPGPASEDSGTPLPADTRARTRGHEDSGHEEKPGAWLVTMEELYAGWFEVHNMSGTPGSTVRFQVRATQPE